MAVDPEHGVRRSVRLHSSTLQVRFNAWELIKIVCLLSKRRRSEPGSLGGVKAVAIVVIVIVVQLSPPANVSNLADDITGSQRPAYCWALGAFYHYADDTRQSNLLTNGRWQLQRKASNNCSASPTGPWSWDALFSWVQPYKIKLFLLQLYCNIAYWKKYLIKMRSDTH